MSDAVPLLQRPGMHDALGHPIRHCTVSAMMGAERLRLQINEADCRRIALTIMDRVANDGQVTGDPVGATFVSRDVRTSRERWRVLLHGVTVDALYLPCAARVIGIRPPLPLRMAH